MDMLQPTTAPVGRLLRLGVVLDTRNPVERLREVARMCDRAGIGALWVEDPRAAPGDPAQLEAWTALTLVAPEVRRARLGALLDAGWRDPALLARMAATLAASVGGRLELTLRAGGAAAGDLGGIVEALRRELAATWIPSVVSSGSGGPILEAVALPAEQPTIAVAVPPARAADLEWAARIADDLVLPPAPFAATLEAAAAARQAAARAGRDPAQLGIAARLPVSVGRTGAEAQARWDAEPAFAGLGRSDEAGIFGTLEQCHDRVVALAHAGVTDLRCLLPNAIDIHDVIAQLTAMTIGSAGKLVPGAPRTRVPEPPPGWGGRPRFPQPPSGPQPPAAAG